MNALMLLLIIAGIIYYFRKKYTQNRYLENISSTVSNLPSGNQEPAPLYEWEDLKPVIENLLIDSKIFIPNTISIILEKMEIAFKENSGWITVITDGKNPLSLQEKKELGLNTRKKYFKEFIQYVDLSKCNSICPRNVFTTLCYDAMNRIYREKELIKLKKLGFKKIEISDCGIECKKLQSVNKIYNINEVPKLPLEGCEMDYCRCSYFIVDDGKLFEN